MVNPKQLLLMSQWLREKPPLGLNPPAVLTPEIAAAMADALECWSIVEQLRAEEGSGVEIVHDNPDFGGPNSVIVVTRDFVDCRYDGDSVLDCLRKAKAARDASDAIQEARNG